MADLPLFARTTAISTISIMRLNAMRGIATSLSTGNTSAPTIAWTIFKAHTAIVATTNHVTAWGSIFSRLTDAPSQH